MQVLVGLVLLRLWKQRSEPEIKISRLGSRGIITDLGQRKQTEDMGIPTNITPDEQEWAREQGADSDDEVLDLIAQHKQEELIR